MDKSIKIILFLLVGLVIISCATTFFNGSSIREMRTNLKNAQASTDAAINELKNSQTKLDSIQADLRNFSAYISTIHKNVELLDYTKQAEDEENAKKRLVLEKRVDSLTRERDKDAVDLQPIHIRRSGGQ